MPSFIAVGKEATWRYLAQIAEGIQKLTQQTEVAKQQRAKQVDQTKPQPRPSGGGAPPQQPARP